MSDGPLTPWAFVLFLCFIAGMFGLVLWRVVEVTLMRVHVG